MTASVPASPPTAGAAAIGVDVGGTKTTAGLVLPGGRVACEATAPTPAAAGAEAVVDLVVDLVAQVGRRAHAASPAGTVIGIGSAGVIDPRSGVVLAATDHIAGWAGTPLAARIAQRTGLPTRALNDVHAHALGETRYGAGRGLGLVLVVAVGTGLGGSLVVDGQPLPGAHGAGGHLGHVPAEEASGLACSCGRVGHLEAVASGPGLLARYRSRGGSAGDAREVIAAAAAGDLLAHDCVAASGRALGRAVGGWVNTIDPDAVIVTGGLARSGPMWWEALTQGAHAQFIDALRSCPILPSQIGPLAAVLGAAAFAGEGVPSVPEAAYSGAAR